MAKDNKPNPSKIKIGPWLIPGALIIFFIVFSVFSGDSGLSKPGELSSSKFNTILEKGDIEKIVVYNKVEAEVFLKKEALKDPA